MKEQEIELKFGVLGAPEQLEEIFSHIGIVEQAKTDQLSNTYFDTPDKKLFSIGAGLRFRKANAYCEQTLKLRGDNMAGLHRRSEFNEPIEKTLRKPDLAKFKSASGIFPKDFDLKQVQRQLKKVCTIEFERKSFELSCMDCRFEVAYDRGAIKLGDGVDYPINELEIELLDSKLARDDDQLLVFCSLITVLAEKKLPLVLEPFSKMHKATVLLNNQRNELSLATLPSQSALKQYIPELMRCYEHLYALFLLRHEPLVFSCMNATLRTLCRTLKHLKRQSPAAFVSGNREPYDYGEDLEVFIERLHGFAKKCEKLEKDVTEAAVYNDVETLSEIADKVRMIENKMQIFVIPLKLRLLMAMLID